MADPPSEQEFVKFTRFFCTRLVQSIVQSRMGDLVKYECSPEPESSDWFNVHIDEIGEIAAYMKSGIKRYGGKAYYKKSIV